MMCWYAAADGSQDDDDDGSPIVVLLNDSYNADQLIIAHAEGGRYITSWLWCCDGNALHLKTEED